MMNEHRQRIADAIRNGRAAKGLRQEDLGALVGVRQPAVAAWEKGTAMPAVDKMFKLAKVLELDVDALLNPESAEDQVEAATGTDSSTPSAAPGQRSRSGTAPVTAIAGGAAP
jgi:transcriptional regulator with XRE-family HTH domain